MTATQKLIDRMLSFTDCFDGYPSMFCSDESLISDAMQETGVSTHPLTSEIVLMSYLASENAKTLEQYRNARAFIQAWVDSAWDCNMSEGSNEVHFQLAEENV